MFAFLAFAWTFKYLDFGINDKKICYKWLEQSCFQLTVKFLFMNWTQNILESCFELKALNYLNELKSLSRKSQSSLSLIYSPFLSKGKNVFYLGEKQKIVRNSFLKGHHIFNCSVCRCDWCKCLDGLWNTTDETFFWNAVLK